MAFCRSLSVYLPDGPGIEAGAEARVRIQETAGIGLGVLLLLVEALPALQRV